MALQKMMKNSYPILLFVLFLPLFFTGCLRQRFLPDPDHQGLSRLTNIETNTGTCYIDNIPYINYWANGENRFGGRRLLPKMTKINGQNGTDSVNFSWIIELNVENNSLQKRFTQISIRIPIAEEANRNDLLGWEGKRMLSDECSLYLNDAAFSGIAHIYFVDISLEADTGSISVAGLFNGNIGDSIFITKGRFDYTVELSGF